MAANTSEETHERSSERQHGAPACKLNRGHQRSSEVIRGHQRSSEVIRGHLRSSEVIRGHQRSSEVIRGHQRSSERSSERQHGAPACKLNRGHQRSSEVIRGHQRSSEVIREIFREATWRTSPRDGESVGRRGTGRWRRRRHRRIATQRGTRRGGAEIWPRPPPRAH